MLAMPFKQSRFIDLHQTASQKTEQLAAQGSVFAIEIVCVEPADQ
jgi:hypothetical protein